MNYYENISQTKKDSSMTTVLELAESIMAIPSITPHDHHCQALISERLQKLGFNCETLQFNDVTNLWARIGTQGPLFVFAGHTDVVPTGPLEDWASPPFSPTVRDGFLYGRGASDMKAAIAAMVIAAENFVRAHPKFAGSIAFLLTSDEEGPALDGTQKVMEDLATRNVKIDYCIVGEPSSDKYVGDQVRIGRRGSLHGKLTVHGKQGHVAHPHLALNPIHQVSPALAELSTLEWDKGNNEFPPTTFQITNVHSGTGAANIIPGHIEIVFNLRFSTESSIASIEKRTEEILQKYKLKYDLKWQVGAQPFLTKKAALLQATIDAIKTINGTPPITSTGGGTSDARFIAPTGAEVVELGLSNATAHHVDECIRVQDLEKLVTIYTKILETLFLT